MFLFRIGKQKISFFLTMRIDKLKYSDVENLEHNSLIEITVVRGKHEMKYLSRINKKKQIVIDKQPQTIPLTLYYDKDSHQFQNKDMVIKGKILSDINETIAKLGQAQLNIAQQAKQDGAAPFALKVELQGNKEQICKITFNIKIQLNADGQFTETTTQNNNSEKGTNLNKKMKAQTISGSRKTNENTPKPQRKQNRLESVLERKQSKSKSAQQQIYNTLERDYKRKQEQALKKQNEQTIRSTSVKKRQFEPISEDNDTVELNRQIPTPPRLKINNGSATSVELKLFQTERLLREKEKELLKVKKQLQAQKKISQNLLEEQRVQLANKESNKSSKQVQSLKTQLMLANVKISDLESSNRRYLDEVDTAHATNQKQVSQITYYKALLQKEKLKMAEVFQQAMEKGDNELISFLEELATQQ